MIELEHDYSAPIARIWELWTTPAGIESWWAPEGFEVKVSEFDLRPGGALVYAMTATGAAQVEFMQSVGMPLTTESRKRFTEVIPHQRLAYASLIDFVPAVPPYEHLTVVDLRDDGGSCHVTMSMEPLHDDVWTERLVAGRTNELENLSSVV